MSKVDMVLRVNNYANPNNGDNRENGVFIPDSIRRESIRARQFLMNHPALGNCDRGCDELYYSIQEVCKRGITESGPISVWNTPANLKRFEKDFLKRYSKEELAKNNLCSIYKSYKEVYGEDWKFDHVEYWWETTFHVFEGSVDRESNDWMDYKKWQNYAHGEAGALTIEEAYIDAAKFAKETLGDFGYDSFVTEIEKENHKKHRAFGFVKIDKYATNKYTGEKEYYREMKNNSKHLFVSNGMENRRWLKWFIGTPYCKKNWGKTFNSLVKIQPNDGYPDSTVGTKVGEVEEGKKI